MMDTILQIKNLKKSFNDFSLKSVNITLDKGYIMGLIGPNGAGKSTIIKLIMNLIKKDDGKITVFGLDNNKHEIDIKNRIGFVYDENHFYEELTISETKYYIAPFYSMWDNAAFDKYIKDFNLPPKKKMKELSKGMKMKMSLAFALSHNADLLIMDEPTSGLDPIVRSELLEILSEVICDENKSVLLSTHITSDLDKIADYITFINNGEVILADTKDNILENHAVIKCDKSQLTEDIKKKFIGYSENEFGFNGLVADKSQIEAFDNEKTIFEKPSLEDIMIYYLRGKKNA